jgi:hypothetical protein
MTMAEDDVYAYIMSYIYFIQIEELKSVYDKVIIDGFDKIDIMKNFIKYIQSKIDEKNFEINVYKGINSFISQSLYRELNCYNQLLKTIDRELRYNSIKSYYFIY